MNDTRLHIIYLADMAIRKKGFNAFTYADIATVMDVSNAALHYYFPSKSDLGIAVMEEEMWRLGSYRNTHKNANGQEQLKHLIDTFYHNAWREAICLMGALTPEFATFDDAMQATLKKLSTAIRDWVTDCLEAARAGGHLRFAGTAADRAALLVSTLLASLLLARMEGVELFQRMVGQLLRDLGADWTLGERPEADPEVYHNYSFT